MILLTSHLLSIDYFKSKLYRKDASYKQFSNLSKEQLDMISKLICIKREQMTNNCEISKLELYEKTLQYLSSSLIHLDLATFDERIAFLIMIMDPDLVMYKELLKLSLMSNADIDKIEDKNEQTILRLKRSQAITEYKASIREKIGFFDGKLLRYEEAFFKAFYSDKALITEIGFNSQDQLMDRSKSLKDFNSISDARYEELKTIAQTCLSLVPERYDIKVASYNVTRQRKLLGLTNIAEQLAVFILLVDSNLDMLRIYEEESRMNIIENRIVEEFGYFDKELLVLERKFHTRFCHDKELSIWTKIKKD